MKAKTSATLLVPAALTLGILLLHLSGGGPEPVTPAKGPAVANRKAAVQEPAPETDVDATRRAEWREQHEPSVLDTGGARDEKELYKRMKGLGNTPVEVVEQSDGSSAALMVGQTETDLESFLSGGGHYSGPLPANRSDEEDQ